MNHNGSIAAVSVCLCLFPLLTDADEAASKACALLTQAEIETAPARQNMASIEKLRPLAEEMAGRL